MKNSPSREKPFVILIGNYPLDRQESMLRFRDLVEDQLRLREFSTEAIYPQGCLGLLIEQGATAKWLAYIDKYILFPFVLAFRLTAIKWKYPHRRIVIHICDHANSVYAGLGRCWFPVVVTCHDLLAIRGARGEDTYCPATGFGKILQWAILRGIGKADFVASVSQATYSDLLRLSPPAMREHSNVVPLALNYPFRPLDKDEILTIFQQAKLNLTYGDYVLHVGSGHPRKNRKAILLAVARIKHLWKGKIVFAGERFTGEDLALVESLGLGDVICEVPRPDNKILQAIYSAAHCLIFMSYSEGFGWPVLEAQASGCPVICSNRTSLPEVAGEGALVHDPDNFNEISEDILHLQKMEFRQSTIAQGYENALKYSIPRMMDSYKEIYDRV